MRISFAAALSFVVALILLIFATFAQAQTFSDIYSFNGNVGLQPLAGVVLDKAGNLYGTTSSGGPFGAGIVYELSPSGSNWTLTTIYAFTGGSDGGAPQSGLTIDASGNLYGLTYGFNGNNGTVFELSPAGGGNFTYHLLHSFGNGNDGVDPEGPLVFDAKGNLYGATSFGGTTLNGTVFELSPNGAGEWTEAVLYNFLGGSDGSAPMGGVVLDTKGNLFGTTQLGGASKEGTIFELLLANGVWKEMVLTSLNKKTGYHPEAGLAIDNKNRLYAITIQGNPGATVIELAPTANGTFTKKVIYVFGTNPGDGSLPEAALTVGPNGSLYGTTLEGGNQPCLCGTVFELTHGTNGTWTETILHNFTTLNYDEPDSTPVFDAAGNLYGTTKYGTTGFGSVFEITPH
jgi:uncharacterized repeat protein (TIGR03803 family)